MKEGYTNFSDEERIVGIKERLKDYRGIVSKIKEKNKDDESSIWYNLAIKKLAFADFAEGDIEFLLSKLESSEDRLDNSRQNLYRQVKKFSQDLLDIFKDEKSYIAFLDKLADEYFSPSGRQRSLMFKQLKNANTQTEPFVSKMDAIVLIVSLIEELYT